MLVHGPAPPLTSFLAVVINDGSAKRYPIPLNFDIIRALQERIAPAMFTPKGVYDGRKNFFSTSYYSFGDSEKVVSIRLLHRRPVDTFKV